MISALRDVCCRQVYLALFLTALLTSSCRIGGASDPDEETAGVPGAGTKIDPGFNLLTPEQDVAIGRQSAAQVDEQLPLIGDEEIEGYVTSIGQRLAAVAPEAPFDYRFRVVDSSDLNAFALPGGWIYLNRGVLEAATSEGEIAGVLAHEIAHVAYRHGTHNVSKAFLTQAGIGLLGGLLGGGDARAASMIELLGGFGMNALFLKYSRTAETQADIGGAQILARAGYDPLAMVRFFETLQRADRRRVVEFLSDHPAPDKRIERIRSEAALLNVEKPRSTDAGDLRAVQLALRKLGPARPLAAIVAERRTSRAPSRPTVPRGVTVEPPSPQYQPFVSGRGEFRVDHPRNWVPHRDDGGGVTLAPDGAIFRVEGSTEIVYGAMVNRYEPISDEAVEARMKRGSLSADEALYDLVRSVRAGSRHLVEVSKPSFGPGSSRFLRLRGRSPNSGLDEQVTVAVRRTDSGRLIFVVFVTPLGEAEGYHRTFEKMLLSIRDAPQGTARASA